MLSTISRQAALGELFAKYPEIVEVYVNNDFTLTQDWNEFYILTRSTNISTLDILKSLNTIYSRPCSVYFAESEFNLMFVGKKMVWRKGRWYI